MTSVRPTPAATKIAACESHTPSTPAVTSVHSGWGRASRARPAAQSSASAAKTSVEYCFTSAA
ncbi:MAG: hypothetical protein DMF83_15320 [Acidobacteria bacterium]|nr:MAG: hypothetical protein DMF83_15320 [Acidobacteriota bacterium]